MIEDGSHDDTDVDVAWICDLDLAAVDGNRRCLSLGPDTVFECADRFFCSDRLEGEDWYRRGVRAHANCVENLPVFVAVVWVISALGVNDPAVNYLSILILVARVCQSLVHVCHVQTNAFVAVRFTFFFVQLACFLALIVMAASYGL